MVWLDSITIAVLTGSLVSSALTFPTKSLSLAKLNRLGDFSRQSSFLPESADPPNKGNVQNLDLLTFDLDDTLFPIDPVVHDANEAMIQSFHRFGYTQATNDNVIAASKQIRAQVRAAGQSISYTDLRKQSIQSEIQRLTGTKGQSSLVEQIFQSWLLERHASADRNLFPNVIQSLQIVKDTHPHVVIGAITNGRGSPLEMPSLTPYFDFNVSGEDDGVFPRRKPHRGIYQAALHKFHDIQCSEPNTNINKQQQLHWIHVGDDLANDVGASADCGAKPILFNIESKQLPTTDDQSSIPVWSTATKQEMKERMDMAQMANDKIRAKIHGHDELPHAITTILTQI